jgi:hypothetical protein
LKKENKFIFLPVVLCECKTRCLILEEDVCRKEEKAAGKWRIILKRMLKKQDKR